MTLPTKPISPIADKAGCCLVHEWVCRLYQLRRRPLHRESLASLSLLEKAGILTMFLYRRLPVIDGDSGLLPIAIMELTAAGQLGTHTPFPCSSRIANLSVAKIVKVVKKTKYYPLFLSMDI